MTDLDKEAKRGEALHWYREMFRLDRKIEEAGRAHPDRVPSQLERKYTDHLFAARARASEAYSKVWEFGPARKYKCRCCDLYTLDEEPLGSHEICPVCWWEDDAVQSKDPDFAGGANAMSLNAARAAFRRRELGPLYE